MCRRCLIIVLGLIVLVSLVPSNVVAQTPKRVIPMRMSDGQPDISGTFTFPDTDAVTAAQAV